MCANFTDDDDINFGSKINWVVSFPPRLTVLVA